MGLSINKMLFKLRKTFEMVFKENQNPIQRKHSNRIMIVNNLTLFKNIK
jgi:hypothetical protein